ncbi:MAG: 4-hydroxy-tetrahydrodipicolinate reductase [Planctomycetes bacterium]|nr:4-hydroxy-tetrahydrodipicolinate reductase [Planctomycetota bacterium]
MSAKLAVAVIGANGRLGRFACELVRGSSEFELVAAYGRGDDWGASIVSSGARIAFEATVAGQGARHGLALLAAGVRPLIATSGVTDAENAELDRVARERGLGGLVVPNFSLGSVLLQLFAVQAAKHFAEAEIVEGHHPRKRDAPSGTALETARRMALARGADPDVREAAREPARGERVGGTTIHSLRLSGLYAHQEVVLAGPGETLTLRHDMSGPAAFAPGIVAALRYAARCDGVARGLELALFA